MGTSHRTNISIGSVRPIQVMTIWKRSAWIAIALCFRATAVGDTVVTFHVDVVGGASYRQVGVPTTGDYSFTFAKNQAKVTSPNGKFFVIDFVDKTFTSVDPLKRSFYRTSIDDVLTLGNQVPPSQKDSASVRGSITFEPNPGNDGTVKSFHMALNTDLLSKMGSPGGFSGGLNPRGGGISIPNGSERTSLSKRRRIDGSISVAAAPGDVDRDHLNAAFECVLLWSAPELKELASRIDRTSLAIAGAQYSLKVAGQTEYAGTPLPTVSISLTHSQPGSLDPRSSEVPSDYKLLTPPAGPFGN